MYSAVMLYMLNRKGFSVWYSFIEANWFAAEGENELHFFLQDRNSSAIKVLKSISKLRCLCLRAINSMWGDRARP